MSFAFLAIARLRDLHRLIQRGVEFLLRFRARIQLLAVDERVTPAYQFAFKSAAAKHLAIQDCLRNVIVVVRILGLRLHKPAKLCDGLIILQVVEMLESLGRT